MVREPDLLFSSFFVLAIFFDAAIVLSPALLVGSTAFLRAAMIFSPTTLFGPATLVRATAFLCTARILGAMMFFRSPLLF